VFRFDKPGAVAYFPDVMIGKTINLYTIGYQGMSIGTFIETLRQNKIELVADIRQKPFSRMKDFSRKNMNAHLADSNIDYIHLERLGSPQELRDKIKIDHDYVDFFKQYKSYLNTQSETLGQLYNLLINKVVCLLCFEKDPQICHRKIVAESLVELGSDNIIIQIIDL
jgi:uncharacterized protein (DUF488 family)